jgi:hypothetical protein
MALLDHSCSSYVDRLLAQTVLLDHVCEVTAVSLALIAAVSLALMMARYTVMQQGFANILPDTGDTAGRAAGSGTLTSPESIPNHHHHCIMDLEPVAFFQVAFL